MIWLIKQLLHIRDVFKSGDTPKQLALGVGLGVMLGLVMSGNLLAVALTIFVCATRANLSVVALSTLCVGLVAPFADPITHLIGNFVLTQPALQTSFEQLYQLPLVPWTNFNHTTVMGSLILGVALVYPTYRSTLPLFRRWKRKGQQAPSTVADVGEPMEASTPDGLEEPANDAAETHENPEPEPPMSEPLVEDSTTAEDPVMPVEREQPQTIEEKFRSALRERMAASTDAAITEISQATADPEPSLEPTEAEQDTDSVNDAPQSSGNVDAFREVPKSNYGFNASAE